MADKQSNVSSLSSSSSNSSSSDPEAVLYLDDSPDTVVVSTPLSVNGENYMRWCRDMMMALSAQKKKGFVDGRFPKPNSPDNVHFLPAWKRLNHKVLSWLLNSLHKDLLDGVDADDDAAHVWNHLRDRFDPPSTGLAMFHLHRAIATTHQQQESSSSSSVGIYFNKLKRLWDEEEELFLSTPASSTTKDQLQKLMQFLRGLHDRHDSVRRKILLMDPLPSLGVAYDLVLQDEIQHALPISYSTDHEDEPGPGPGPAAQDSTSIISSSFDDGLSTLTLGASSPDTNKDEIQHGLPPVSSTDHSAQARDSTLELMGGGDIGMTSNTLGDSPNFNKDSISSQLNRLRCAYCIRSHHTIDRCRLLYGYNHKRKSSGTWGGEMEQLIQHFSHMHSLKMKLNLPTEDEKEDAAKEVFCSGCRLVLPGPTYGCDQCKFVLHQFCSKVPRELYHPAHPQHPLTFLLRSPYFSAQYRCDACGGSGRGFNFQCAICSFDLHVHCASLPSALKHESHHHPLILTFQEPISSSCRGCGLAIKQKVSFTCSDCSYDLHLYCASLPPTITNNEVHQHPLILSCYIVNNDDDDDDDDNDDEPCIICGEIVDQKVSCWLYNCKECDSVAHTNCAAVKDIPGSKDWTKEKISAIKKPTIIALQHQRMWSLEEALSKREMEMIRQRHGKREVDYMENYHLLWKQKVRATRQSRTGQRTFWSDRKCTW